MNEPNDTQEVVDLNVFRQRRQVVGVTAPPAPRRARPRSGEMIVPIPAELNEALRDLGVAHLLDFDGQPGDVLVTLPGVDFDETTRLVPAVRAPVARLLAEKLLASAQVAECAKCRASLVKGEVLTGARCEHPPE